MNILIFIATLLSMEIVSYSLHRWVFHGFLWSIHKSHHRTRGKLLGVFELNDVFSIGFAMISITLFLNPATWWVALGITVYGLSYFFVHDALTHRRFIRVNWSNPLLDRIKRAHRWHHRDTSHRGQEPFGLFYVSSKVDEQSSGS